METALVIEGGFSGRTFDDFDLGSLNCSMLGASRFNEVYIDTESGNQYLIYCPINEYDQRTHEWFLFNSKNLTKVPLSKEDMEKGILKVGESFIYNKTGKTTPVTQITCVNTYRKYVPGYFKGAKASDIRNQFAKRAIRLYI